MTDMPIRFAAHAAIALAACLGPTAAHAQERDAVLHKIELHPGRQAGTCIGPQIRRNEVLADLAVVPCDRSWTVFTFVAGGAQPSWDPVGRAGVLVHERTGLCVGSQGDSAQPGTRLVLDDCAARDSQRWVFSGDAIVNARTQLCLGTAEGGLALDQPVVQAPCSRQAGQAFAHSRTVAPRQLAGTAPGRPVASRTQPPATGARQALQACGLPSDVLADQLSALPPAAATAMAGACLAERHAGRLLRAGFHVFYVNRAGRKQRIDLGRIADCGFRPTELVQVEPEILDAIPTGEPLPADGAACRNAREG
jgi:hypothetical protein